MIKKPKPRGRDGGRPPGPPTATITVRVPADRKEELMAKIKALIKLPL